VKNEMKKTMTLFMVGLMILTVVGTCAPVGAGVAGGDELVAPIEGGNLTGTVTEWLPPNSPIENTTIFIAGGHVDPIVIVIDSTITDENGEYRFEDLPAGVYTILAVGPDVNGSAVAFGNLLKSAYLPRLRFTSVSIGSETIEDFTLIKRPLMGSQQAVSQQCLEMGGLEQL
jgi:hypothetical protein